MVKAKKKYLLEPKKSQKRNIFLDIFAIKGYTLGVRCKDSTLESVVSFIYDNRKFAKRIFYRLGFMQAVGGEDVPLRGGKSRDLRLYLAKNRWHLA